MKLPGKHFNISANLCKNVSEIASALNMNTNMMYMLRTSRSRCFHYKSCSKDTIVGMH